MPKSQSERLNQILSRKRTLVRMKNLTTVSTYIDDSYQVFLPFWKKHQISGVLFRYKQCLSPKLTFRD